MRNQPAALDMPQNELATVIDGFRNLAAFKINLFAINGEVNKDWRSCYAKSLLNMAISKLWEILSSLDLFFEFGLVKSDLRQPPSPKFKSKNNFLSFFDFTFSFFQAIFTRWVNSKLKCYAIHLYFIFSVIF